MDLSLLFLRGKSWLAWGGGLFLLWLGWRTLVARPPEFFGVLALLVAGGMLGTKD